MAKIINNDKVSMSFEELCKIWDYQQRLKARNSFCKQDRAKKTLTPLEKYNKYAQLGHPLRYKQVSFVFNEGMGELTKANGVRILGATIYDFLDEIKYIYGITFDWAKQ